MQINDVNKGIHKRPKRKRLGRGLGSGLGKTAGRGHKGEYSRSGKGVRRGFEGGQMPLMRRVAKRGFNNYYFAAKVAIINVAQLEAAFENGERVDPDTLAAKGLAKGRYDELKILGNGELTKKLTVTAHRFSQSAVEKITAAGGTIERILVC